MKLIFTLLILTGVCIAMTTWVGNQISGDFSEDYVQMNQPSGPVCEGIYIGNDSRQCVAAPALTWSPVIAFAVFVTLSVDLLIADLYLLKKRMSKNKSQV